MGGRAPGRSTGRAVGKGAWNCLRIGTKPLPPGRASTGAMPPPYVIMKVE